MKKSFVICLRWYLVKCERISNLKPGSVAYKTAWDRLKKEYGQVRLVVNSHIDEIVNLDVVKGKSYEKVQAFYDKLSVNHDALRTFNEHAKLDGFVMCTLNKLSQVKPDLVRTDEGWEEWSMEKLIDNLHSWLRRNKTYDLTYDLCDMKPGRLSQSTVQRNNPCPFLKLR